MSDVGQEFFGGPAMVLQWIWSGGTISLQGTQRKVGWKPSVDMKETTAGADTTKKRKAGIYDATADISLLAQKSPTANGGTLLAAALAPGTGGTLIISPEGTATGMRKITHPSLAQGGQYDYPYNDLVTVACSFVSNGAWTDGVY